MGLVERDYKMKSLKRQVGGDHYKKYKIEPITYVCKNKIIHTLANIIKYATRANTRSNLKLVELREKIEDLNKIKHYAEIEIEVAIEEYEECVGPFPVDEEIGEEADEEIGEEADEDRHSEPVPISRNQSTADGWLYE